MPRQRGQKQNFQFNKGWNTEASALTFPENTAKDIDNVVLDIDGSIRRRMGVITDGVLATRYFINPKVVYDTKAIGFFKWENVAGSGDLSFLVSQFGTKLQFNKEDNTDVGSLDFSDLIITGRETDAEKAVVEVASGLGYLFVTGPYTEPFYCVYDVETGAITKTTVEVEVRDFEGIDDGLDVDERPTTLTQIHLYNLRNQGWLASFPCDSGTDPVERTNAVLGSYPSNADIISFGKIESADSVSDLGKYDPNVMSRNVFGTSPAPRGKYIFNAFNIDRSSIVSGATNNTVNNRPRAVSFHNGRAFFAGVNAVGYTGKVYYSQQITDETKIGKCYQENDPTAEEFNELLATDGGEIIIPNCGNILRLAEGPSGIVVFASNGLWEITGAEGKFSATEFYIRKVTDLGCIGGETVINADGDFFYFSDAGIVGTTRDQVTGNISADVITRTNIQLGYLLFGGPQRRGARGTWIRGEKKAVWLYSLDTEYDSLNSRFKYNGVLVLDASLGAFYKYTVSDFNVGEAPYISGIVETSNTVSISKQEEVTAEGVNVIADAANVTISVDAADPDTVTSTWKLQAVRPKAVNNTTEWGIGFATFSSRKFVDWYFEDGVGADYTSYLETGYDYGGQSMFEKRPTHVYTYMSRVSKSNLTGGFYNIPDPADTETWNFSYCSDTSGGFTNTGNFIDVDLLGNNSNASSITFSPDGTKLIVTSYFATGRLYQYALTTPFDISTATHEFTWTDSRLNFCATEVSWRNSTHLAITATGGFGGFDNDTYLFLSSPYDISGGLTLLSTISDANYRRSTAFISSNIYADSEGRVWSFTGNDISTSTVIGDYRSIVGTGSNFAGAKFQNDGYEWFSNKNSEMTIFDLTTPYDLSTAVFRETIGQVNFSFALTGPTDIVFVQGKAITCDSSSNLIQEWTVNACSV